MKISLSEMAFPTSRVCQAEGAAASQPRSLGQTHSRATRGPVGPVWRPAGPQGVKQTNQKKQKKGKKKERNKRKYPSNNSNNNKAKQKFLTVKVRISVGDAPVNPPASRPGPQNHVEGRPGSPKNGCKPPQQSPVGTEEPAWGCKGSPQPSLRPNPGKAATQEPHQGSSGVWGLLFVWFLCCWVFGLFGVLFRFFVFCFFFKGGRFVTTCSPLTPQDPSAVAAKRLPRRLGSQLALPSAAAGCGGAGAGCGARRRTGE